MDHKPGLVKMISSIMLGIIILVFSLLLAKKGNTLYKLGLSLILGGAASNVYDRIKRGYVVDYFSFKFLKRVIFNLSDLFIFIGAVLISVVSLFEKE
jgi:signal peptidase II